MAFKQGKQNVYTQFLEKNQKLKDIISRMHEDKYVEEFANRLCNSIGVMLATKPYTQWPEIAKIAFTHEQRKTPTSAHIYRERLPKK